MECRALYPAELEAWFEHVTDVFSGNRQYFVNHWENDPWKNIEGIRVAVDDGKIVSTLRVFIRKMFLHGEPISVGGIGEVSTRREYQRRGLATLLLKDSIHFMKEHDIAISSLHGSQRIYALEGWEKIQRYYARETFVAKMDEPTQWNVRPVNFQSQTELNQIAELYDGYSRKFNGTFVRDDIAYWTDWVQTESPNIWAAERNGAIEGYVSVTHDKRLTVEEFAVAEAVFAQDRGKHLFQTLIAAILTHLEKETFEVAYAAPIADGFKANTLDVHGGTMYRVILPNKIPSPFDTLPSLLHNQPKPFGQGLRSHHLFWSTDGF